MTYNRKNDCGNFSVLNKVNDNFNFSFSKSNNFNNNSGGDYKNIFPFNANNFNKNKINEEDNNYTKKNNGYLIYNLLNKNKEQIKDKNLPFFAKLNNINQTNNPTKPKFDIINYNCCSPKNRLIYVNYYSNNKNNENNIQKKTEKIERLLNFKKINNIKAGIKKEMLKVFDLNNEADLPYEIKYFFLENPEFNYDFKNQNDVNSNFQYINENFIDILLNSYNKKIILNSNIRPLKEIQTEINFSKRNILIAWFTEINFKYIKDQNVFFTAVKYLDFILYHKNININEFQILGIICFNLALKMENHHKVFYIKEIIALIGGCADKESIGQCELTRKIIKMEHKICDLLNFDLETSTSVLILQRLIQMLNISNKRTEKIFLSIAFFFLELSLYEEEFYKFDEFSKALSSLIITKEILKKSFYKTGFHNYLNECSKLKLKEIKHYYSLCIKTIKDLKSYKYGSTIFIKYQHEDFNCVVNNYLSTFILDCIQNIKI